MTFKKLALISALGITVSGCFMPTMTPTLTEEQRQYYLQAQQNYMKQMQQKQGQMQVANQQQQAETFISEAELLTKVDEVKKSGGPAVFERRKDGIMINNQMYNDFEGVVSMFGGSRLSGDFTYTVQNYDGTATLKFSKANTAASPVKIATIQKNGSMFNVKTVTGKTIPGQSVIPTSDGFVVGRAASAFRYVIGSDQVKSITIPTGYHMAMYQNGDVASTGLLLLERDPDRKGSTQDLLTSFSDLGNTLGLNKSDDYVLMNVNDSSIIPLNVTLSGKDISIGHGCQSNGFVNKCQNFTSHESLYLKSGFKNWSHYFWAVNWIDTKSGPLAIYRTTTTIDVVDINNKQVHTAFSRALGVNEFDLIKRQDGTVGIEAKLGFSKETIDDVDAFIQQTGHEVEPLRDFSARL